ncbi:MAG: glycosidase [Halanaerobiales bacterium]
MKLKRVKENPVLTPRENVDWEKDAVFNSGVYYEKGTFYLLYRAVAHREDDPNRSSIGYAWSEDGINFKRKDQPVLRPGVVAEESQGVEDPRITKIDDKYHMFYTAYDNEKARIARAESENLLDWERRGIVFPWGQFGDNKDAALFSEKINDRYVLLHRPVPDIYLSFSDDLENWTDHQCIMEPTFDWESKKIGTGAQPIKTEAGWLLVYHGVDRDSVYRLGIALLDLENPSQVIKRQSEPILEPETEWELQGDVNNVVFTCGAVLVDGQLWVYYGGADTVIGLARAPIADFLKK